MGCDFYIYKYLEIEHKNGTAYYSLKDARGWFCELGINWYESDDEDYNPYYMSEECKQLWKDMVKLCLTPRQPFVLYKNDHFVSERVKDKYLPLLQNKINNIFINEKYIFKDTGIFESIEDIIQVTKKEIRYEPGKGDGPYFTFNDDCENEDEDTDDKENSNDN